MTFIWLQINRLVIVFGLIVFNKKCPNLPPHPSHFLLTNNSQNLLTLTASFNKNSANFNVCYKNESKQNSKKNADNRTRQTTYTNPSNKKPTQWSPVYKNWSAKRRLSSPSTSWNPPSLRTSPRTIFSRWPIKTSSSRATRSTSTSTRTSSKKSSSFLYWPPLRPRSKYGPPNNSLPFSTKSTYSYRRSSKSACWTPTSSKTSWLWTSALNIV